MRLIKKKRVFSFYFFKKKDEQLLPETPNIITVEEAEITESDEKQKIEKLKDRKSLNIKSRINF